MTLPLQVFLVFPCLLLCEAKGERRIGFVAHGAPWGTSIWRGVAEPSVNSVTYGVCYGL